MFGSNALAFCTYCTKNVLISEPSLELYLSKSLCPIAFQVDNLIVSHRLGNGATSKSASSGRALLTPCRHARLARPGNR